MAGSSDPPGDRGQEAPEIRPAAGEPAEGPPRELPGWYQLWSEDRPFPIRSHRGGLAGRALVAFKRLFRPLVKTPQADLWDRQRVFNVILLEELLRWRQEEQDRLQVEEERRRIRDRELDGRIGHLENFVPRALDDVLRHNDALFARVDQKLDRHRREVDRLLHGLGAALSVAEGGAAGSRDEAAATGGGRAEPGSSAGAGGGERLDTLLRLRDEQAYLAFERRFRGTEEEVRERLREYLGDLEGAGARGEVLDLGCGRGEALAVLAEAGLPARGVDASAEMVARARERGFRADEGDLFEALAAVEEGALGGVVSFHVIEHLPPTSLDRLARLAWRALAPGGVLILETPNPLSLSVAARSFWLDPTHRRPVHPETLELLVRLAGFDPVERRELRPFGAAERLPEIDLAALPEAQRELADRVNRLRDVLDDLLFGYQDYAVVARKP